MIWASLGLSVRPGSVPRIDAGSPSISCIEGTKLKDEAVPIYSPISNAFTGAPSSINRLLIPVPVIH